MRPGAFRLLTAVAVVAFTAAAACGADPNDREAMMPEEAPVGSDPDADESDAIGPGNDDDAAAGDRREVRLAVADAAEHTGVTASDIEVVEFAMVTWPDGAIGCPEPGMVYTQALVDGYRIVLDADGTQLTYHGATGDDPFLCRSPGDPVQPTR